MDRAKAVEVCNALVAEGGRIINVLPCSYPSEGAYEVWYEHERAGDDAFVAELGKVLRCDSGRTSTRRDGAGAGASSTG